MRSARRLPGAIPPAWPALGLAIGLGLIVGACSSDGDGGRPTVATAQSTTTEPRSAFCAASSDFNTYVDENGTALLDPAQTEVYMAEAQSRIRSMSELADDEVKDDIDVILDAYAGLDEVMAEVDYDLLQLDDGVFRDEAGIDASLRLDQYLFDKCGFDPFAHLPFEGEAPEILSGEELDELVTGDADADLVADLAGLFEEDFGLATVSASCLAENMDRETVVAIAGGAELTQSAADDFVSTLAQCDIDEEVFTQ